MCHLVSPFSGLTLKLHSYCRYLQQLIYIRPNTNYVFGGEGDRVMCLVLELRKPLWDAPVDM